MKKASVLFVLLLILVVSKSQDNHKTDSLRKVMNSLPALNGTDADTLRLKTAFNLANQYLRVKPDSAKIWYLSVADTITDVETIKKYPVRSKINANILRNLGMIIKNQGNIEQAMDYYDKALKIASILDDIILISDCYLSLGVTASYQGDYKKAIDYTSLALSNFRSVNDDKGISSSLISLGVFYSMQGLYVEAEPYYREALEIKRELGDRGGVSKCLNNLGLIAKSKGDYNEARSIYIQSLELAEKSGDRTSVSSILVNLGNICLDMGDFPMAVNYLEKALGVEEEMGNQSNLAITLASLGIVYMDQANFDEAVKCMEKALAIREKINDKKGMSNCFGQLGAISAHRGDYSKANEYFKKSLEIDRSLGDKSGIAFCIENLGNVEYLKRNISQAKEYYQNALELYLELNDGSGMASSYVNLGNIMSHQDSCVQAVNLYESALEIYNSLGIKSSLMNLYSVLSRSYKCLGNIEKSAALQNEANKFSLSLLRQNFTILSEKERELILKKTGSVFNDMNEFMLDHRSTGWEVSAGTAYNNELVLKGLLLKSSSAVINSVYNSSDSEIRNLYFSLKQLRNRIAEKTSGTGSDVADEIKNLEDTANLIERKLVQKSAEIADINKLFEYKWEDVHNSLKRGEAAIEFFSVRMGLRKDSVRYGAIILRQESVSPILVDLFSEKDFLRITGKKTATSFQYISGIYGKNKQELYNLIWKPLDGKLQGIKEVNFSPAGLLNGISFAALLDENGKYLCEKYDLHMMSTTGILIDRQTKHLNNETAVVFGGIDYNSDTLNYRVWEYLPGTMLEKDLIVKLFNKNLWKYKTFFGQDAREDSLKAISEQNDSPSVLHISTHGFFYPDPTADTLDPKIVEYGEVRFRGGNGFADWMFVRNPNPMMRSGLVFAGANRVWNEDWKRTFNEGVLTAYEVSNMNLRQTELVVLSACETGLGDIRGSEGVYGLQRAFKMAGVRFVIMSLWQVPDKETVDFMETFYRKLLKSKTGSASNFDVRKAFTETQKEMRDKYDPYFWAAFVLVE